MKHRAKEIKQQTNQKKGKKRKVLENIRRLRRSGVVHRKTPLKKELKTREEVRRSKRLREMAQMVAEAKA